MGKFSVYKIPLKTLADGAHEFEYTLDGQYFKLIGDGEADIKTGSVEVRVSVKKISSTFEFNFVLNGYVVVPCDRCLDDMTVDIDTKSRLIVKFGESYSEESDEIVIIPEHEGEINIAWFLYEFVTLDVPMKHVHPAGTCNKAMTAKYNKHRAISKEEDDDLLDDDDVIEDTDRDITNDPRWDALKSIIPGDEE